jgi:hypothetical protein
MGETLAAYYVEKKDTPGGKTSSGSRQTLRLYKKRRYYCKIQVKPA